VDVYDAASARRILRERLTSSDSTDWSVRSLAFTRAGEGLGFRICDQRTGACDPPVLRPIPGAAG
jgi:hypothetical protein